MYHSRIARHFACKMAMLLALMFAACSNDDTKQPTVAHDGGYTEETGIYALSGRAGDFHPKLMKMHAATLPSDGLLNVNEGVVVIIHELDSLTLEKSDRVYVDTIDNQNGQFAFGNLSLISPYVLIEIQDSCTAYDCQQLGVWGSYAYPISFDVPCNYDSLREAGWEGVLPTFCGISDSTKYPIPLSAIVDVRKYNEISINSLTYMKIPLVKKYFAEGMGFAAASKKAEQELLENFGIYEDLGDFESLENVNGELSYVLQMMSHLAREDSSSFDLNLANTMDFYYAVSPAAVARLGESAEQAYLNTLKMIDYEIGYYVHKKGFGACTESRENETHYVGSREEPFGGQYLGLTHATIVCRSQKWVQGWIKIDYTSGTMTDNRDGKTYKTVTYDWDGVTQTWMAENLNYADTTSESADSALKINLLGSTRCRESDPTCELYGRSYTWLAAMNLSKSELNLTTVFSHETAYDDNGDVVDETWDTVAVEEQCLAANLDNKTPYEFCIEESATGECLYYNSANSLYDYCTGKYWNVRMDYSAFIPKTGPTAHQGVCPDGWRIPNKEDWDLLFENVTKQGALLNDAAGSGFGYLELTSMTLVDSDPPELRMGIREISGGFFASVPDTNDIRMGYNAPTYYFNLNGGFPMATNNYEQYGNITLTTLESELNVRCIKD